MFSFRDNWTRLQILACTREIMTFEVIIFTHPSLSNQVNLAVEIEAQIAKLPAVRSAVNSYPRHPVGGNIESFDNGIIVR